LGNVEPLCNSTG